MFWLIEWGNMGCDGDVKKKLDGLLWGVIRNWVCCVENLIGCGCKI